MANLLLDALGDVGYALDTPGAFLRGALAGRPGDRVSGEDLLSSYGVRAGPWGGLAAEMVVDPLTLLPPAYGAYRGSQALARGASRGMRGLASHLDGSAPLARYFADVDAVGGRDPARGAVGDFLNTQGGWLKVPIPGVPDDLANAMDGLGPQYPGGVAKLRGIADSVLPAAESPTPGTTGFRAWLAEQPPPGSEEQAASAWHRMHANPGDPSDHELWSRIRAIADGEFGERVASEIPEGSSYLGRGAEGITFRTPEGSVIRVGDDDSFGQAIRPELPEMLQAFRATEAGPYRVEHMPMVRPLDATMDLIGDVRATREGLHIRDVPPGYAEAVGAGGDFEAAGRRLANEMRLGLLKRGDPWDVRPHNVGLTAEGKGIVYDGGAIKPLSDFVNDFPPEFDPDAFRPKPAYDAPEGELLRQVLEAGGPEKVRESLRAGLALGTAGQGVDSAHIAELLRARSTIEEYLARTPASAGMNGVPSSDMGSLHLDARSPESMGLSSPGTSGGSIRLDPPDTGATSRDPMEALRADYRASAGSGSPVVDAIRRFLSEELGAMGRRADIAAARAPFGPDAVASATGRRASRIDPAAAAEAYAGWAKGLTPEEQAAIRMYTQGSSQSKISHALRGRTRTPGGYEYDPFGGAGAGMVPSGGFPIENPGDVLSEVAPYMDSALSRGSAPRDLMTYRLGRQYGALTPETAESMVGEVVSDPSYLSTTLDPFGRFYGRTADPSDMLADILVPEGAPGGYVDSLSSYEQEKELLLPRDARLRVAATQRVPVQKLDYEWYRLDAAGKPMPRTGVMGDSLFRGVPEDAILDALKGAHGEVVVPDEFMAPGWESLRDRRLRGEGMQTNVLLEMLGGGPAAHLPATRRRTSEEVLSELSPLLKSIKSTQARGRWKAGLLADPYPDSGTLYELARQTGTPVEDLHDLLRSIPR